MRKWHVVRITVRPKEEEKRKRFEETYVRIIPAENDIKCGRYIQIEDYQDYIRTIEEHIVEARTSWEALAKVENISRGQAFNTILNNKWITCWYIPPYVSLKDAERCVYCGKESIIKPTPYEGLCNIHFDEITGEWAEEIIKWLGWSK